MRVRLLMMLGLVLAVAPTHPGVAGEPEGRYERGDYLRDDRWILWSTDGHVGAAILDVGDQSLHPVDVSSVSHPCGFAPITAGRDDDWLVALDVDGEDAALVRISLKGTSQIVRRYSTVGEGRIAPWIRRGPGQTVLLATQRGGEWTIDVMNPRTGAVEQQVGPLPLEPRDAIPLAGGAWVILDAHRLFTWPGDEILAVSAQGAPNIWVDPPPMVRWGWAEQVTALPDEGGYLLSAGDSLFLVDAGHDERIAGGDGWRYPADGPAFQATLDRLAKPVVVSLRDDRILLWEAGSQRLLRLMRPEAPDGDYLHWSFQTQWTAPGVKAPEQAGQTGVMAPQPPATVDEVLASWAGTPWEEFGDVRTAEFWVHQRGSIYVLHTHREQAIPALLAQASPQAALALSILGAEEAEDWLRELVLDPTPYRQGDSCSYPHFSVGMAAFEHLHGEPFAQDFQLKGGERRSLRKLREAAAALNTPDGWCGDAGHARLLLEALGDD